MEKKFMFVLVYKRVGSSQSAPLSCQCHYFELVRKKKRNKFQQHVMSCFTPLSITTMSCGFCINFFFQIKACQFIKFHTSTIYQHPSCPTLHYSVLYMQFVTYFEREKQTRNFGGNLLDRI